MAARSLSAAPDQRIAAALMKRYDRDGNGRIAGAEAARTALASLDDNRDGAVWPDEIKLAVSRLSAERQVALAADVEKSEPRWYSFARSLPGVGVLFAGAAALTTPLLGGLGVFTSINEVVRGPRNPLFIAGGIGVAVLAGLATKAMWGLSENGKADEALRTLAAAKPAED